MVRDKLSQSAKMCTMTICLYWKFATDNLSPKTIFVEMVSICSYYKLKLSLSLLARKLALHYASIKYIYSST